MELKDIVLPSEEEIKQNLGLGKDLRKNNPYGFLIALCPLKERKNGSLQWLVYNTDTKNTFVARADKIVSGTITGKTRSQIISENNAKKAKDLSGRLICCGVAALIGFQSFVNICVVTGMMPNTGLPLPFVSYGLTSLVSSFIGIGLVLLRLNLLFSFFQVLRFPAVLICCLCVA